MVPLLSSLFVCASVVTYVAFIFLTPGCSPAYLFEVIFVRCVMHLKNIGFLPVLWGS